MTDNTFFDESTEQSRVKATIVQKYFWAWAKVIMPSVKKHGGNIAYIDLFAGPGRYKDGTKSTPLLVLEQAIQDPDMCERLVTIFNDRDEDNSSSLQNQINTLPGIAKLKETPMVEHQEVGTEIVRMFESMELVPTLFFVDPWGYKGLSLRLVNSVLKDWGCDCIFFFNYNRVNMGLTNPMIAEHMNALFGQERANLIRPKLTGLPPAEREMRIIEELCQALLELGGKYVLPFRFRDARGTRTSHHLIFVSKHVRGYDIMKGIMAKESSRSDQGVPSFEYNRADARCGFLFEFTRPMDELKDRLLTTFAGQTLTMKAIFERHNVGTPYISRNYKDALSALEATGKISAEPPAAKRRRNTFADRVVVRFPRPETI